jgi:hypothetical protein
MILIPDLGSPIRSIRGLAIGLARVRTLRRAYEAARIAVQFKKIVKSQAARDLPS